MRRRVTPCVNVSAAGGVFMSVAHTVSRSVYSPPMTIYKARRRKESVANRCNIASVGVAESAVPVLQATVIVYLNGCMCVCSCWEHCTMVVVVVAENLVRCTYDRRGGHAYIA